MDDNRRDDRDRGDTYTDLVDAVVRGTLHGTGTLDELRLRRAYIVELGDWEQMIAELFMDVLADEGCLRRARTPSSPGVRGTYIVEFDE
ncbi:hypothetical protein DB30_06818 [Enhygromyxa salina]|uniref:Uncharacterized protein n=1 Tax=Enhygromyxa salina TaxID=215803 RepID=A0A0C2CXV6_9BACT|nr:hypothetical protein [Enhygromyxa salina]KIG14475.1 hypothetical protein DB30_06818 [Enhygromyxa salina]